MNDVGDILSSANFLFVGWIPTNPTIDIKHSP